MKHILNFLVGATVIGGVVGVATCWAALSVMAALWLSGGAMWGLFLTIVFIGAGLGGGAFAISEAGKSNSTS